MTSDDDGWGYDDDDDDDVVDARDEGDLIRRSAEGANPDVAAAPHHHHPSPAHAAPPPPTSAFTSAFTNAKAGMEGVDREMVKRVVHDMSVNSAHFATESRKEAAVEAKILAMKKRAASIRPSALAAIKATVDDRVARMEASRDLTKTWVHVDMDSFFASGAYSTYSSRRSVPARPDPVRAVHLLLSFLEDFARDVVQRIRLTTRPRAPPPTSSRVDPRP
jgi:hypothetical protein